MFCPFCKTEIVYHEFRDAIENNLRFPHINDIDIAEKNGTRCISVLLDEPCMTCTECHKEINLNQDGLLVGEEAETAVKIMVKIET